MCMHIHVYVHVFIPCVPTCTITCQITVSIKQQWCATLLGAETILGDAVAWKGLFALPSVSEKYLAFGRT